MLSLGEGLPSVLGGATLSGFANSASRNGAVRATAERASREGSGGDSIDHRSAPPAPPPADAGVEAYAQAAQKMVATGGGAPASAEISDPRTMTELARLKATDAAVRAHEAAHVGAGGSYVRGAAAFTYQEGPDGKQYAVGGEVGIDTSPVAGNPQATILKMITVRAAALAPADPSAADRAVAAAAAQQEAAARAELLRVEGDQTSSVAVDERPSRPDSGQTAAELTEVQARQVQATYGAFAETTAGTGPVFQAAA